MWKSAVLLICLSGYCLAGPVGLKRNMPIMQQGDISAPLTEMQTASDVEPNEMMIMSSLTLPSNATSIRADITDGFSCQNKTYGYYADVDNDCQIFHVCLPVTYADGKENTFRWSFICPEETIFSQDSFTCMRPDDMTITCDESYQYYELNRNFGMVDSAGDKETNNEAAGETVESNETILEAETEPEAVKPVVQEEDEKIVGQSKPVNVKKPIRRRPTISYATQKKPAAIIPLRKITQTEIQPEVPETPVMQVSEVVNPVDEEEIKPAVQKFSRRPGSVMSNAFKDKIQNSKPETVMATRTELFNQIRKRPTMFNKKPVEQEQQQEEEKQEDQVKIETKSEAQNFSPMASELSIANTETKVADSEIEASETNNVFVRPEEANKNEASQNVENNNAIAKEPVQVLEAFEEIPAIISEVIETPTDEKEDIRNEEVMPVVNVEQAEKSKVAEEPQIAEEIQSEEESHEVQNAEDIQPFEETKAAEDTQETQSPDATQTAEETQTGGEIQATEEVKNVEKTQTAEEVESAQETQAAEGTLVQQVQQSLRTSAEETQNTEESQASEEVAQETPFAEETHSKEKSQAAEEVAKEPQIAEEIQTAEKTKTKSETAEKTQVFEIQSVEKTRAAEEQLAVEETQTAAKDEQPLKEPQVPVEAEVAESQTAEDETPEVAISLRTSAEETQNSEETQVVKEESPVAEEVQTANIMADTEETQADKEAQSPDKNDVLKEGPVAEEVQTAEESQFAEETQSDEEPQENEQIPAEQTQESDDSAPAFAVEEPQPIEISAPMEDAQNVEESQIIEEAKPAESSASIEENVVPIAKETESVKSENVAEPAIYEENSEEGSNIAPVQAIEEMESEKPVKAPESMIATEVMNHPNAIVQQMYEDMDANKQSIGGFKAVDPVMAHEAEQLIVDFINTLRKNDFTNETPGMHVEQHIDEVNEQSHENVSEVLEAEKVESNEVNKEETEKTEDKIEHETIENQDDSVENNAQENNGFKVEESKQESETVAEENNEANEFNALKSLEAQSSENLEEESQKSGEAPAETMNLPPDMYQIPVRVISTPVKDVPMQVEQSQESEIVPVEMSANTDQKVQEEAHAMPMVGFKPLSIDDIVELVKDRLDHMPKNEMETPMQLEQVLSEAHDDKEAEEVKEKASQSEEKIVLPIYQRIVQPVDAEVQTDGLEDEQSEVSDDVADVKEKSNRSYRSRSMLTSKLDPRKRRFLFKADSS